jgi:hypothetical protein
VAVTPKVAGWPRVTVWLAGWVVMAGLMALTVKVAGELVTVPAALDTETVKTAPVSPMDVEGVV